MRALLLVALVSNFGWWGTAATAADEVAISDRGAFFSAKGVEAGVRIIEALPKGRTIRVATEAAIPTGKAPEAYFRGRFPRAPFDGVFVLITGQPRKVWVASSRGLSGLLPQTSLSKARQSLIDHFRRNEFDRGLSIALAQLSGDLSALPAESRTVGSAAAPVADSGGGFPWQRILFILAIIAGIGMLISLFRSRRRPAGAGADQPGMGGGGGGFLSSILGGIAGAMAGNWLYDQFFGSGGDAQAASGDTSPPSEPAPEAAPMDDGGGFGDLAGDFSSGDDWGGGGGDDW